jgi:hypothetical protein
VITATGVPQPSLEVPASVDRIYADEADLVQASISFDRALYFRPALI